MTPRERRFLAAFLMMAGAWCLSESAWWFAHQKYKHLEQVVKDQQSYIDGGCNGRYQGR